MRKRTAAVVAALTLLLAACGGGNGEPEDTDTTGSGQPSAADQMVVSVASYETVAGQPNRLIAGLQYQVAPEEYELVSFGDVRFSFAFLGTEDDPIPGGEPFGEEVTASFLPVPNEDGSEPSVTSDEPILTVPSEARGVYAAQDVTFDQPGFYQLTATAEVTDGSDPSSFGTGRNEAVTSSP